MKKIGKLYLVSGPSGVGKTTLCDMILNYFKDIKFSISTTTRPMRAGEKEGERYNFITKEKFEEMIKNDEFLEWAEVHGNYYGTRKDFVFSELNNGNDVLIEIDVQGGKIVKQKYKDVIKIFIAPASINVLRDRLFKRKTDTEEVIKRRLENAKKELDNIPYYNYLIINKDIHDAFNIFKSIIIAEKCKIDIIE